MSHVYSLQSRDAAARRELWACLALRGTAGVGMRRINALLSLYGSAYEAVQNLSSWRKAGIPSSCIADFSREVWRQPAYREWTAVKHSSCGVLLWVDEAYPPWLRTIADAPPFLYFYGDVSLLRNFAVAIVGMRSCSEEGIKATVHIARGLCRAGVSIISGMAKGIDRAAHLAGLEGPGGSIGVLGAGIDVAYPRGNADLYALMREKGLLLSEYPPGFGVDAKCFPVRNRIISGLSRAVVVVEAAVRSGSLNTASHALEQGRELMAVPGPVTASSAKGCQELVRRGAKPVFCGDDVLQELVPLLSEHVRRSLAERDVRRFQPRSEAGEVPDDVSLPLAETALPWRAARKERPGRAAPEKPAPLCGENSERKNNLAELDGIEADIYSIITCAPVHIDDICRSLEQDAGTVSRIVALLEVQGMVKRLPGMIYSAR